MAQTTTNYGLLKPEATDAYNHLIYDNPNMDTIDAALKANSDAAITSATCIKSGTTHTITRSNTSASVMKFTATGDWNTGDTMIIDGVTVSAFLPTGEALKTGAYVINSEVIVALVGTRATVFTNQSEAGTTYFDDSTVIYTASNAQDAINKASDASGTRYTGTTSVKTSLDGTLTGTFTEAAGLTANVNDFRKVGNLKSFSLRFNALSVAANTDFPIGSISEPDFKPALSRQFAGIGLTPSGYPGSVVTVTIGTGGGVNVLTGGSSISGLIVSGSYI